MLKSQRDAWDCAKKARPTEKIWDCAKKARPTEKIWDCAKKTRPTEKICYSSDLYYYREVLGFLSEISVEMKE